MITKKLDTGTILFLEVPQDAFDVEMEYGYLFAKLVCLNGWKEWHHKLSEGDYILIGLSTEPDEDKLREVMPRLNDMEFNGIAYEDFTSTSICDTAVEAYQSLKVALGVVDSKKYIVLFERKKDNND